MISCWIHLKKWWSLRVCWHSTSACFILCWQGSPSNWQEESKMSSSSKISYSRLWIIWKAPSLFWILTKTTLTTSTSSLKPCSKPTLLEIATVLETNPWGRVCSTNDCFKSSIPTSRTTALCLGLSSEKQEKVSCIYRIWAPETSFRRCSKSYRKETSIWWATKCRNWPATWSRTGDTFKLTWTNT